MAREQLATEPVALAPLFEQLRAAHADQAAARGIALVVRANEQVAQANPAMLQIAVRNLLDNAMRYCPDGSRIELAATRADERIVVAVRDNGPGVDAASRQRLTERFYRVLGHGSGQGGSGLGLSIVQRIVELHGGSLVFGAGLDGGGLGVAFDLPAARSAY